MDDTDLDYFLLGGCGLAVLVLYLLVIVAPSWYRASSECSSNGGAVVQQHSFVNPYVCQVGK